LIKWRDLQYDQATWELDGGEIAAQIRDWKKHVDQYWTLKKYVQNDGVPDEPRSKRNQKGKKSKKELAEIAAAEEENEM
jgi:hypothetical protein